MFHNYIDVEDIIDLRLIHRFLVAYKENNMVRYSYAVYIFLFFFICAKFGYNDALISSVAQLFPYCFVASKTCPNENIKFYLYTSSNPTEPVELRIQDTEAIKRVKFENGPIKFLIHGYLGDKDATPNTEIRPAYFQQPRAINVISIDYGPLVRLGCYIFAVQNTRRVANCTAQFFERLLQIRPDLHLSQIHFIGLSLGAQVAGETTQYLTIGRLERITTLDAAYPLYPSSLTDFMTVRKGQAKFMDALHTNAGFAGKPLPYADVDFYANGGTFQPGCIFLDLSCSHIRSAALYAETINVPQAFPAHRCSFALARLLDVYECRTTGSGATEYYGEYVNHSARGTYFFKTGSVPPYYDRLLDL